MWINLDLSDASSMKLITSILVLIIVSLMVSIIVILVKKNKCETEVRESLKFKDDIIKEYQKIRHDYNNMLQSLICFIEEEDLEGLKDYKEKVLAKTYLLNRNNLTQMIKLQNKSVFTIVYKLLMNAKKSGVVINLTICNDIKDIHSYDINFNKVLHNYINCVYEEAAKYEQEINLKINANEQGFRFVFENQICSRNDNINSNLYKTKIKNKSIKNVFLNTFMQEDKLIQEILITIIK
jgi:two-component system sensor histidine kinase AgrC